MGVCVEPPEYVLGLRPFEPWVFRTRAEGVPSGPGDLELITIGSISLPVPEPGRAHLMAVRRGELPLAQVVADLHAKSSELEQAVLASALPETADAAAIDAFLVRAHQQAWSGDDV